MAGTPSIQFLLDRRIFSSKIWPSQSSIKKFT